MQAVLEQWGFVVLDAAAVSPERSRAVPRVVYHGTASRTVVAATNLVRVGVPPGVICTIVDSVESLHALSALSGRADEVNDVHKKAVQELAAQLVGDESGLEVHTHSDSARARPMAFATWSSVADGRKRGTSASNSTAPMEIICAPILYDDVLRTVRVLLRAGHSPGEIQNALDERFYGVLRAAEKQD